MKKITLLLLILCGFLAVYSQNEESCINKVVELTKDMTQLETTLRAANDSISRLIEAHKSEVSKLSNAKQTAEQERDAANKKVKELEKDLESKSELKKQVKDLEAEKKDKEKEKKNLTDQVAKLTSENQTLKQDNSKKGDEITAAKQEGERKATEQYKAGEQSVYARNYQGNFDDLIKSSTLLSVQRDLALAGNDAAIKKKLEDLKKYFSFQQLLSEPYDKQKVAEALRQIAGIEQSDEVKKLTEKLQKYELYSNGLQKRIEDILEIDKNSPTYSVDTYKEEKQKDMLYVISDYCYNYYSYIDYPYLSKTVSEIIRTIAGDPYGQGIKDLGKKDLGKK